jgi:hypothetical protein
MIPIKWPHSLKHYSLATDYVTEQFRKRTGGDTGDANALTLIQSRERGTC